MIEGHQLTYTFSSTVFTDLDTAAFGDTLSYSATENGQSSLPTWLFFDRNTRTFSGIPERANVGTITIEVTATDPSGGTGSGTFQVTVSTNQAPVFLKTLDSKYVEVNENFIYSISSSVFDDTDAGDLSTLDKIFTLVNDTALPTWMYQDTTNLAISGVPPSSGAGTYEIKFTITDVADDATYTTFLLYVNAPPELAKSLPALSVLRGSSFVYEIPTSTFSDENDIKLLFSVSEVDGSEAPTWTIFNQETNELSGTPGDAAEDFVLLVTATDSYGAYVNTTMQVLIFEDTSSMSAAAKAGVIVGVLLGTSSLIGVGILVYKVLKRKATQKIRNTRNSNKTSQPNVETSVNNPDVTGNFTLPNRTEGDYSIENQLTDRRLKESVIEDETPPNSARLYRRDYDPEQFSTARTNAEGPFSRPGGENEGQVVLKEYSPDNF